MRRVLVSYTAYVVLSGWTMAIVAQETTRIESVEVEKLVEELIADRSAFDEEQLLMSLIEQLRIESEDGRHLVSKIRSVASQLRENGAHSEAIRLYEEAIKVSNRLSGEEYRELLTLMSLLGSTLNERGYTEDLAKARDLHEAVLAIRRRILEPEDDDIMTSINELASVLQDQGDLLGAKSLYEESLEIRQRTLGEDHKHTLTSMNNLASTLFALGEFDNARQLFEILVSVRREKLGTDNLATLTAINNLAATLLSKGETQDARRYFREAYIHRNRILGRQHPATLETMMNLAICDQDLGRLSSARKILENVVSIYNKTLGKKHPKTLNALLNLATVVDDQGNLREALRLKKEALDGCRETFGEKHLTTTTARNNLALSLRALGDTSGALLQMEKVLSLASELLGAEHPSTLTIRANMAQMFRDQGDLANSRLMEEEVLSIRRKILGSEHTDTLSSITNLAGTLTYQGDFERSLELFQEVLDTRHRINGPEHPLTLGAMTNLAFAMIKHERFADAQKIEEKAVSAKRLVLGEEHPATLASMNNLAVALTYQNHLLEAQGLLEKILSLRQQQLGDEHPETLQAKHNLGVNCYRQGEFEKSSSLLSEVAEAIESRNVQQDLLGTFLEVANLHMSGIIKRRLKEHQAALDYFYSALDILESQNRSADVTENVKSQHRAQFADIYRDAISISVDNNRLQEAFRTLERYRAQSYLALIYQRRLFTAKIDPALETERHEIAARYDAILRELESLKKLNLRYEHEIAELHDEQVRLQRHREVINSKIAVEFLEKIPDPLSLAEIDQTLDPGTLLIAYSIGEESADLFALSRDGELEVHELKKEKDEKPLTKKLLNEKILEFKQQIRDSDPDAMIVRIENGKWLYRHLLRHVANRIAKSDRLLILPDGPLHYLPFAALVRETGPESLPSDSSSDRDWQYLIEWKPLHTVLSATVYAELLKLRPREDQSKERNKRVLSASVHDGR